MEKELKNSQAALIDKVTINGFYITAIADIDLLVRQGLAMVSASPSGNMLVEDGTQFSSIRIGKTDYFDQFVYGHSLNGFSFGVLELSVPDDGFHNLNGLTLYEYRQQIADALRHLHDFYGITIAAQGMRFKAIEINRTIELDHPFEEYSEDLLLMKHEFPAKLQLRSITYQDRIRHPSKALDNEEITRTYELTSGRSGLKIKIYDKSEHLKHMMKDRSYVTGNYLRFEITLLTGEKIKRSLGTNLVAELTDEDIQEYFNTFIERNVVIPHEKYAQDRKKAVKHVLRECYTPGSHTWVHSVLLLLEDHERLHKLPILLDIEEVIKLLDNNVLPISPSLKCYYKKRFCAVCHKDAPSLERHDAAKYRELLVKLSARNIAHESTES